MVGERMWERECGGEKKRAREDQTGWRGKDRGDMCVV
jgi:hypothetical protein